VRLRVAACGICRTGLHVIEGELPRQTLPIVPGHQIVGTVDAVVPGAFVYELPDALDVVEAAPLLCAGIVGYRSFERSDPRPGPNAPERTKANGNARIRTGSHGPARVRTKPHGFARIRTNSHGFPKALFSANRLPLRRLAGLPGGSRCCAMFFMAEQVQGTRIPRTT